METVLCWLLLVGLVSQLADAYFDWVDRRHECRLLMLRAAQAFHYVALAVEAEPELTRIRARLAVAEWRAENRPRAQA
jgi:hypothetical protein